MKKKLRYLTTTLAATSFLAYSSSYALGIGGMKLQSALNQNLKAEISLILSEGENPTDLKIGLASNARFDDAGIPWTLFLSKIKFQTITRNGVTVIKLSSSEVLKEPFLDFLIEVRGVKSTVYREFTVLIDPPEIYKPIQDQATSSFLPRENTPNPPRRFVSAPTHYVAKSSLAVTKGSGGYGPIRMNESLWRIASKFNRQNKVSVNQMMAEIYAANPDAFRGSADVLVTGKVLKIPGVTASTESVTVKIKPKTVVPKEKVATTISNPSVNATVKSVAKIDTSVMDQKLSELEQQLSEMKKTIADQNAQISALKVPAPQTEVPKNVVVEPLVSVVVLPEKSPELPTMVIPPAVIPQSVTELTAVTPATLPVAPIAVMPAPVVTTSTTSEPSLSAEKSDYLPYSNIPEGSYYYVAEAAGLLLLSLLGWLRLRNKTKVKAEDSYTESVSGEKPDAEINVGVENPLDKMDAPISSSLNIEHKREEFENSEAVANFEVPALSEFNPFMDDDSGRYLADLLYKIDVYCAYGDYDKAILTLRDEFTKHPDANDYALRLLKLYVLQDNKTEFIGFISELVKLGKKEALKFWEQVCDIADDFYPEAVAFVSTQAIPDSFIAIPPNDMVEKVDSNDEIILDKMNFDGETIAGGSDVALNAEELLNKATDDFFKTLVQFDDVESMKSNGEFLLDEFKLELPFDSDFTAFEAEEPVIKESIVESEFDLDFTTFEAEGLAIKDPKFESGFDLDFTTFEAEEPTIKVPKFESEFDLDFTIEKVSFDLSEPKDEKEAQ